MGGGVWWRIAWRNLWRHRRRTLITAVALAFGFLAAVVMIGLSDGIIADMVETGTAIVSGQIQIHAPDYLPERQLYATIGGDGGADIGALLTDVESTPGVVAAAPRVYAGGLLAAGDQTQGAILMGLDPVRDERVVRLLSGMTSGTVPSADSHEIAIGEELARTLDVQPGDTVVVVAPASDGSLGNDLYRVAGLFRTGSADLDGATAVFPIGPLRRLLALDGDRTHEIIIAVDDPWAADSIASRIRDRIGTPAVAIEAWSTFRPELAQYTRLAGASNFIIVGIVFVMAVFGVANTMLMGTYERRREFAVVRALGGTPHSIVRTVLIESVVLGAIALAAGAAITLPLIAILRRYPIDLSRLVGDFTMAGALIRPVLRVQVDATAPLLSAAALLLTSLLAAMYPAFRASRVPPADALSGQ